MLQDKTSYILFALLVLSYTITPFIRKKAAANFTNEEFFIFSNTFVFLLILMYSIYLFKSNKCSISMLSKINKTNTCLCALGAITGMAGSILLTALTKTGNVSSIIPQVQPIVIMLNIILAYFLFGEDINKFKVAGVVVIILGLILINYGKKK